MKMKLKFSTKIILLLVAVIAVLLLAGCGNSNASETQAEIGIRLQEETDVSHQEESGTPLEKNLTAKNQRVDVCLVLDVSDRMRFPGHVEHDLAVGNALVSYLSERAKRGLYFTAKDRLCVDLLPQASTPPEVSEFLGDLGFDIEAIPVQERRTRIPLMAEIFQRSLRGLLETASQAEKYSGGDVYKYVVERLRTDSTDARNILVLVTDGYFYNGLNTYSEGATSASMYELVRPLRNKPNWRELISKRNTQLLAPENRSFPTLEVLVIGVRPLGEGKFWNEYELLEHLIGEFFSSMNVKRIEIHAAYNSADTIRDVVYQFLESGV